MASAAVADWPHRTLIIDWPLTVRLVGSNGYLNNVLNVSCVFTWENVYIETPVPQLPVQAIVLG
jgi:hypothetical protein